MKKLLHERLREWVESDPAGNKLMFSSDRKELFTRFADEIERYYIPREEYDQLKETKTDGAHYIMKAWADERGCPMKKKETITQWLDRYYIPRPRFEDGEPVNPGDETDRGTAWVIAVFNDGDWHVHTIDGTILMSEDYGSVLKRPSPKVLDADGVEIKVGETVWDKHGDQWTVEAIVDKDSVYVMDDCGVSNCFTRNFITHKEPDSLEKLRDDMHKEWLIGFEIGKEKARDWSDRLSTLIEKVD